MSYTEQQLAAIQADVGNVLVSAAAGSGKTKVLVERIMQAITREKDPVDIDKILIVTFWLLDLLIADSRTAEAREVAERMKGVEHSYHYEMYMGDIARAEIRPASR